MRHTDCCSVCLRYSLSHGSFLECHEIRSFRSLHSVYNRSIKSSRRRPFLFTYRCLAFAVFFRCSCLFMLFVSCLTAASVHARNSLFFFTAFRLIGTPLFQSIPRYAINPPCPTFVSVYITVILGTPPFSSTPRYAINLHSTAGPRYAPVSVHSSVRH